MNNMRMADKITEHEQRIAKLEAALEDALRQASPVATKAATATPAPAAKAPRKARAKPEKS